MLEFAFDFTETRRALSELSAALDRQTPSLLGEIGARLKERTHADFMVKSRGGTGAGGITWKAVTPDEQRKKQRAGFRGGLGVRTGELLSSLEIRSAGETAWGKPIPYGMVSLEFVDQPKANAFNVHRPLFPDRLPHKWHHQSELLVQQMVDHVAAQVLGALL